MQFLASHNTINSSCFPNIYKYVCTVPYMYGHDRSREDFFVTDPGNFNISLATDFAKNYEKEHLIDPLHHLNNSRVYIYHGTKDSTVYHGILLRHKDFVFIWTCNIDHQFRNVACRLWSSDRNHLLELESLNNFEIRCITSRTWNGKNMIKFCQFY